MAGAQEYEPQVVVELLGRKTHILDLTGSPVRAPALWTDEA